MASEATVELLIKIRDEASQALKQISEQGQEVGKRLGAGGKEGSVSLDGMREAAGKVKEALAAIGIGIGFAELVSKIKEVINEFSRLNIVAIETGIAPEILKAMDIEANKLGTSMGNLIPVVTAMSRAAIEGSKATNQYTLDFHALAVALGDAAFEAKNFAQLTPEQQLVKFVSALKELNLNSSETNLIMKELTGKNALALKLYQDMGPAVEEALKKQGEFDNEIQRGIELSRDYNQLITNLRLAFEGLVVDIFGPQTKEDIFKILESRLSAAEAGGNAARIKTLSSAIQEFKLSIAGSPGDRSNILEVLNQELSRASIEGQIDRVKELQGAIDKLQGAKKEGGATPQADQLPAMQALISREQNQLDLLRQEKTIYDEIQRTGRKEWIDNVNRSLAAMEQPLKADLESFKELADLRVNLGYITQEEKLSGIYQREIALNQKQIADLREKKEVIDGIANSIRQNVVNADSFRIQGEIDALTEQLTKDQDLLKSISVDGKAAMDAESDSLKAEIKSLQEKLKTDQEILALKNQSADTETKMNDLLDTGQRLAAAYALRMKELTGTFGEGFSAGMAKLAEESNNTFKQGQQFAQDMASAITNDLTTGINSFGDASLTAMEKFKKFSLSVITDIGQIIEKMIIVRAIGSAMSWWTGGGGGIGLDPSSGESFIKPRASGGPASGLTLVGERGPEIVKLPGGSMVYSNSESKRMLSGGGNAPAEKAAPIVLNMSVTAFDAASVQALANSPQFQQAITGGIRTSMTRDLQTRQAARRI